MKVVSGRTVVSGPDEYLDPRRTALLVIDMQNDFVHEQGHFSKHGRNVRSMQAMLPRLLTLLPSARDAGVRVAFIQQTTLPAGKSDSAPWLYFKTRDGKSPDYTIEGPWGHSFYEVTPARDDLIIPKFRPSAFSGTDLARLLRNDDIEAVVCAGVVTQGCVLATTLDASFSDFYAAVATDAVQSPSQEQHENALRFLTSRYDVMSNDELARIWAAAS